MFVLQSGVATSGNLTLLFKSTNPNCSNPWCCNLMSRFKACKENAQGYIHVPIFNLDTNESAHEKHKAMFVGDYWSFRGFGYSSTDSIYLDPDPTSSYGPLLSALEFFEVQDLGFFESNDRDGKHPHPEKFGANAF